MAGGHISASFHLQRSNKGPLESSRQGAHDRAIISDFIKYDPGRFIRAHSTARGLERNLHLDKSSAAPASAEGIVKKELPRPGPPFPNMRVCRDAQLPKLNPDSTVHFQQCYYTSELPVGDLDNIQKYLGMSGQITARRISASKTICRTSKVRLNLRRNKISYGRNAYR